MKDYNLAYQLDGETTDNELVARYGLDPRVAGTPAINKAVREAVYLENLREAEMQGIDKDTATQEARKYYRESEMFEQQMKR